MKELMVTLLVLSCTGMVWAQQDNSNGFRPRSATTGGSAFDGSSSRDGGPAVVPIVNENGSSSAIRPQGGQLIDRSGSNDRTRAPLSTLPSSRSNESSTGVSGILDRNRRARESFSARPTERISPLSTPRVTSKNRVERLAVPTAAMDILQRTGVIEAEVADPNADRITISDRKVAKGGESQNIRGSLRGSTLVFSVTQEELQFINEGTLEFNVPNDVKGKYRTATIEFPAVLRQVSQTNSARGTNSSFQADDRRWNLAGAGNTPVRTQREQPVTNQYDRNQFDRNQYDRNQFDRTQYDRNQYQREQVTTNQFDRNQFTNEIIQRSDPFVNSNNNLIATQRELQQRAEYDRWLKEKESRDNMNLVDENRQLQNQIDRLRWDQQQVLARQQQTTLPTARFADNSFNPLYQQQVGVQPVGVQPVQPVAVQPVGTQLVAPVAANPMG